MATATDDFERGDETPVSGAGNWLGGGGGLGNVNLASNVIQAGTISADCIARYVGTSFGSAQFSEAEIANIGASGERWGAAAVRMDSGGNYYAFYYEAAAGNGYIFRYDGGGATQLAIFPVSAAATHVIRCEASGATISAILQGTEVTAVSDSTHVSGAPGVGFFVDGVATDFTLDNWEGGDLAGATDTVITPPQANLVLSTTIPQVIDTGAFLRNPAAADLVLSTTVPNVENTESNKIPAAADLVLSTVVPTVFLTARTFLSIPAADLALSTEAPTVALGTSSHAPAAADLILTTTAPSVILITDFVPAAANLILTTTIPTVVHADDRDIIIPGGNLFLSTTAPSLGIVVESDAPSFGLHIGESIIAAKGASLENIRTGYSGIVGKH